MARFSRWLRRDYDGVITLVVVAVAVVLEVLNVLGTSQISGAILFVLGLLAFTILRERHRTDPESQPVRLLSSFELGRELEEARRRTHVWTFKGGTGTYLRAVTLPQCVEKHKRERRPLRIQVEIIDPTNATLCREYASLRHYRQDGTGEGWTPERTRNEALATILAACWYLQRHNSLRVDVACSATVPTFRWDLSSTCVLMTQEDPSPPHLMFRAPSPHYDFCTRELDSSFRQARRVPLELARKVRLDDPPSRDDVRCLFGELGMEMAGALGDEDIDQVIQKALEPKNPYPSS